MKPTHALTVSGRTTFELTDAIKPVREQVERSIRLLDGEKRFSLVLFRLPEGKSLDQLDTASEPQEYLQCAGSAERMTVELREIDGGGPRQDVLGHEPPSPDGADEETVRWSDFEVAVLPSEVFGADEAVAIFTRYLETGDVDPTYHRRAREDVTES